ncbi:hypothetical protein GQX73_g4971 [Xylaria multiplex]|uniref:F-box domain-containing protein n=1 Tax=Xylaria multiplex TaxID=323545 RepID=A0A7C8J1F3_9PEZI|nr:hypothetical protein GQX73_g4971 [Xylaria multiplex]
MTDISAGCGNTVVPKPPHPSSHSDENILDAPRNNPINGKGDQNAISTATTASSNTHRDVESDTEDSRVWLMQTNTRIDDEIEKAISESEVVPSDDDFDVTFDSESAAPAMAQNTTSNEGTTWDSNNSDIDTMEMTSASYNGYITPPPTAPDTSNQTEEGYSSDGHISEYSMPNLVPVIFENTQDDHVSDDSCASHDSFISKVLRRRGWPPGENGLSKIDSFIPKKKEGQPSSSCKISVAPNVDSESKLEKLPSELRIQILSSMPDLETLCSIIHASPTMHTQYLYARHEILSACLDHEFNGFYVDTYANVRSRPTDSGWKRSDNTITDFLGSYQLWMAAPNSYPGARALSPSCVRWMAAFHISVARPLARRLVFCDLENLRGNVPSAAHVHDIELSRSEEIRIFRALYRHQTYHHLFGQSMGYRGGGFEFNDINEIFFGLFDPWENEAIGCVDDFLRQQWGDIFDEVQIDIDGRDIDGQDIKRQLSAGAYYLYKYRDEYLDGMVSRGLRTMARILALDDLQDLATAMDRCIIDAPVQDAGLARSISHTSQVLRRDWSPNAPSARDEAERQGQRVSFAGDLLPPDGPPLAWVVLWDGRYTNFYGGAAPTQLKRWGYVMWDARRWADVGEKELRELFVEQWKKSREAIDCINLFIYWEPSDAESSGDNGETDGT